MWGHVEMKLEGPTSVDFENNVSTLPCKMRMPHDVRTVRGVDSEGPA